MQPQGNVMKKSLLMLVLASAAAISGCVTSAGYRGHGGGYYGASSGDYRYGRSDPYGYYGGSGSYYGYDRYGYDRYGRSYGYPYGYAPYYNNNRYYYYYPTPQRPPTTGTNTPPPQLDPNRPYRDNSRYRRLQAPSSPIENSDLSRDLSRYRSVRQEAPAPVFQDRPESVQSIMENSPRRMRPERQQIMPRPSRAPAPAQSAPNPASVLDSVR